MAATAIHQEKVRVLGKEREVLQAELTGRADQLEKMGTIIADRDNSLAELRIVRSNLDIQVGNLNADILNRDRMIADLNMESDNQRIELVTKTTEQDHLNGRLRELNLTRKSQEEKLRQTLQDMRAAQEKSRKDTKRISELERNAERLISQLSDREERLERRETELLRLKGSLKSSVEEQNASQNQLFTANQRMAQLEREVAKLSDQKNRPAKIAGFDTAEKTMNKLQDDKVRLIAMVRQLSEEKNILVERLKAASNNGPLQDNEDAKLRTQMHDLAAKVVSLTAESEGAKSPIAKLLQSANKDGIPSERTEQALSDQQSELPISLAERVKALQKSAQRS
ncbi:MAG: hypothetical protein ACRCU5_16310 [Rhizobiaceae bacterium]